LKIFKKTSRTRIHNLKDLKTDDFLIITKADKRNTVVILERDEYDRKIETILKDSSIYKKT
jgi:hypothetical protein